MLDVEKLVAKELKDEFEAEGAYDIYNICLEEAEHLLTYIDSDRMSQYLYHVSGGKVS